MQSVNAAIERLEKRASEKAVKLYGLDDDLKAIANALRELGNWQTAMSHDITPGLLAELRRVASGK